MSLIRNVLQISGNLLQRSLVHKINPVRTHQSFNPSNTPFSAHDERFKTNAPDSQKIQVIPLEIKRGAEYKQHSLEECIAYMDSAGYEKTYGNLPVWSQYRRNHKGGIPPRKTRRTCIRNGKYATGNPCPICRDEYLRIHYDNVKLLKQFIADHNGAILSYSKTGICQVRHQELLVAICRARNLGLLTFDVPIRYYNYSDWYSPNVETITSELSKNSNNTYTQ